MEVPKPALSSKHEKLAQDFYSSLKDVEISAIIDIMKWLLAHAFYELKLRIKISEEKTDKLKEIYNETKL